MHDVVAQSISGSATEGKCLGLLHLNYGRKRTPCDLNVKHVLQQYESSNEIFGCRLTDMNFLENILVF